MLIVINTVALLIILAVCVYDFVTIARLRRQARKSDDQVKKLEGVVDDLNNRSFKLQKQLATMIQERVDQKLLTFMDLQEFQGLDPLFKERYRKYVVGQIMPAITAYVNEQAYKNNVDQMLRNDDEVQVFVDQLVMDIKTGNSATSIFSLASSSPQPVQSEGVSTPLLP